MKIEGLLFAFLAVFLLAVSAIYWVLSHDPSGFTCLVLSGGLAMIIGYYVLFTARRMEERPEDRPDAEIAEGAGEIGFFAPHSWWPLFLAGAFTLTTLGLVFGPFLVLIGFVAVLITAFGFVFEYYLGINRSQGETLSTLDATGNVATSATKFLGEQH
jgi:hypothetical protein